MSNEKRKVYGFIVPEGYNWVAIDKDRSVWAYTEKPIALEHGDWDSMASDSLYLGDFESAPCEWQESLVYMPALEKDKDFDVHERDTESDIGIVSEEDVIETLETLCAVFLRKKQYDRARKIVTLLGSF